MFRALFAVLGVVFFSMAVTAHGDELGGGWQPDYTAMYADPETKNYIGQARSKLGGNCCEWADGFIAGKVYRFTRYRASSTDPEVTYQTPLKAWWQDADGYYHAVVWDYIQTGRDVELIVSYDAFAPHNPTGRPIVWIRSGQAGKLEISCWGGEAQG